MERIFASVELVENSWPPQVKVTVTGVIDPRYYTADSTRTIIAGHNPYLNTWTREALESIRNALLSAAEAGEIPQSFVEKR
jgi:hypothetical protein